ncbi:hypothetical protein PPERSA_08084 [Pseudocohnilembus persalinus]|uniref:Transmembrane protein n=1 Tax=Pseudocohnilembus persalinus TaxID=266149 RepID=A0A0V0R3J2_PSEPJ|nr:hypothetical protein PPERSA_08084 [Pseudocohnilembus persalinus]|eukprot:KRX08773.1 hypothetical protein PPERSA_08084 [Pseudocohnilembus persalinus]
MNVKQKCYKQKNPNSQEQLLDDNIDYRPTSARDQTKICNKQKLSQLQNINQQLNKTLEDINLTNSINSDQEEQQKNYSEQSQDQKNQDQTISLIDKNSIQDYLDENERLRIQIEQQNTSISQLENYSNQTQENDNQNEFQLNSNFQRDNPIKQVLKTTFIISSQYNKIKYVIAMINTIFLAAAFSPFMVIPTEDLVENCYKA